MAPMEITGDVLLQWARLATSALQESREEINALNVFPVPDSDTGSNMAHTMQAALDEATSLSAGSSFGEIARALATGAVRGARGNSGVVLSQVFRGLSGITGESAGMEDVSASLGAAVDMVTQAIADPKEGTVLTVLRAAARAAQHYGATIADVVSAANKALAETPSQLEELRRAGVVDAGGRGLVVILGALEDALSGGIGSHVSPEVEASGSYLEVMFYFSSPNFDADIVAFDGDSFMVARDTAHSGTIHVHTRTAGELITEAFARGTVTHLRIEALPDDPRDTTIDVVVPESAHEFFPDASTLTSNRGLPYIYVSCGLPIPPELPLTAEVLDTNTLVEAVAAVSMFDPHVTLPQARETMQRAAMQVTSVVIDRGTEKAGTAGRPWVARCRGQVLTRAATLGQAVEGALTSTVTAASELVTIIGPTHAFDAEGIMARVSESVAGYATTPSDQHAGEQATRRPGENVAPEVVTHASDVFCEIGVE